MFGVRTAKLWHSTDVACKKKKGKKVEIYNDTKIIMLTQ